MQEAQTSKTDWRFLLPLVLSTTLNPINSSMLVTALGTICHHFSEEVSAGALLITPLYIAATIGQPLMGRLADLYDPKTINKLGIWLVLLAGIIGVVAPDFSWLIVSRILLGIGTSAAYPSAMALVSHRYGQAGRAIPGNVLGIITVASQVSIVIGPVLGGALTQLLGWQGVFLINIPWTLITLYLSRRIASVPRVQVPGSFANKIDLWGIVLFACMLVGLLLTLINAEGRWAWLAASVLFFGAFVYRERRLENPFIDIRLLQSQPSLLLVYLRTLGAYYVLYLLLYALPQWVEAAKGMSPAQTGFIILPMTLMSALSALGISRIKNIGHINKLGLVLMACTCAAMFLLQQSIPIWQITCITLLAGVSMGFNIVATQSSLSAEVPEGKTGVSFGLARTFGYLGAIVSGTQIKTVFGHGVDNHSIFLCSVYASVACVGLVVMYAGRRVMRGK